MLQISKIKNYAKNLILIIVFTFLTISIAKDSLQIYAVSSMNQKIYVPIIMYHQIINNNLGKDAISPYEFESDLKFLSENNYNTITMTQLINYVYEDGELPQNPIVLSFDDGYLTTYKYVFPLLKKYNMKIVLSIVGKSTDDFTRVNDTHITYAHLTWNQINEMQASGLVEIQNHSYNLHKVCNGRYGCGRKANETVEQYESIITEDVSMLQDKVKLITNNTPNTFSYPYGKYNDNLEDILKGLGFKATFTVKYGINIISKDPESLFGLKRICRAHNQGVGNLIKGGMETLKYIDD